MNLIRPSKLESALMDKRNPFVTQKLYGVFNVLLYDRLIIQRIGKLILKNSISWRRPLTVTEPDMTSYIDRKTGRNIVPSVDINNDDRHMHVDDVISAVMATRQSCLWNRITWPVVGRDEAGARPANKCPRYRVSSAVARDHVRYS